MAEELVSTVGILATSMANCNVVRADENGVVILSEFPKTVGNITLGGGGYIPGKGIVIGEGNGTTQSDDVIIGSNITTTDAYYEGGNIAIGNKAEVAEGSIAIGSSFTDPGGNECTTKAIYGGSVAIGRGAHALGGASMALGYGATTSCLYSTALGTNACAYGFGALAIGHNAEAAENEIVLKSISSSSTACNVLKVSSAGVLTLNGKEVGGLDISEGIVIGEDACAGGLSTSIAIGTCACASNINSIALGYCACASGSSSTALGHYACASGVSSTALGAFSCASGDSSTALGHYACASCYSTAIGVSSKALSGAVAISGGILYSDFEGSGNEILITTQNTCEYEYCETTKESTSCSYFGCVSYLKVSRDGVLTVNDQEMAKKEDIVSQVNTMVTNATKVDTTDSNFTLTDVANALNTLIDLLKANQQA